MNKFVLKISVLSLLLLGNSVSFGMLLPYIKERNAGLHKTRTFRSGKPLIMRSARELHKNEPENKPLTLCEVLDVREIPSSNSEVAPLTLLDLPNDQLKLILNDPCLSVTDLVNVASVRRSFRALINPCNQEKINYVKTELKFWQNVRSSSSINDFRVIFLVGLIAVAVVFTVFEMLDCFFPVSSSELDSMHFSRDAIFEKELSKLLQDIQDLEKLLLSSPGFPPTSL